MMMDRLPSWNDGAAKRAIVDFVTRTTAEGGPDYVPAPDRVALFDNDGTLWVEQPMYTQLTFVLDDVRRLAPQHPEWASTEPFKSVLENDLVGLAAAGVPGVMKLLAATQCGMTTEEFNKTAGDWVEKARHPRFDRLYTQCVYQPMLELIDYLKANDFEVYIVTGGGVEFVRAWAQRVYGVPPRRVVGSSLKTKFELRDAGPALIRTPEINLVNDGPGKPVGIHEFIGKQPIAAFGNSDGDLEMLQWTAAGTGARLLLLVHHTDSEREYAYDAHSAFGMLSKALDEARSRGWIVVDMKRDWNTIFSSVSP
ncbi:MAG TPA: HAD family hydrolase [Candidatus Acidoferrales bacterium]|nr:HAD family hydrolase [Candidatus Acidoferrales bacterium]